MQFAVAMLWFVQFLKTYVLQGSVATRFGCGGIFNDNFIVNFPECAMKEFLYSILTIR